MGIRRTAGDQEFAARWLQHGRAHLGANQDGKERVVPLTEDVLEVLRRHQKAMEAEACFMPMDLCL